MNKIAIIALAVMVFLTVSLSWVVDYYRNNALTYKKQRDETVLRLTMTTTTLTNMQKHVREVSALDKNKLERLNAAEFENDNLRRQLASGVRRMFIRGKCSTSAAKLYHSSPGMGDDTAVELSREAGQDILNLRADIIRDNEKLRLLQQYIIRECH